MIRGHSISMLLLACAAALAVEGGVYPPQRVQAVSMAEWQADIAPGWGAKALVDPASLGLVLLIPQGTTSVPMPLRLQDGTYDAAAWKVVLEATWFPTKNAMRLLGKPTTAERLASGALRFRWEGQLSGAQQLTQSANASVELEYVEETRSSTWRYTPAATRQRM